MEKRGANEAEKWRLFVAVELPPAAKEALVRLQEALRRQGLASWRWVRPEGVHLTLKFLGETPVERVPEVERAVSEAVAGTSAFEMALAEPGAFSDRRGPRVLWVGLSGDVSRLAEVQRRLEERLAATGFPREERPFSPHLTL
ncbi:MAG: RNA 2',3'-cyclic phosphodiesterase, partial [Chloroflexi bacterium]|nr:RNA 2',3'-cyclic phosphodiesterase [Chloroflexota bacterium]